MTTTARSAILIPFLLGGYLAGCAANPPGEDSAASEPPPAIRAWMNRLTVEHRYDPETGFIVAEEVVGLPDVIASGPPAKEAVRRGGVEGRLVVVFATADRCAPCQQYKKSALNDAAVIQRLGDPGLLVTHVEVDREPDAARAVLGSLAIPMTYAFRDGEQIAVLRGQRSAEELLAWLETLAIPQGG